MSSLPAAADAAMPSAPSDSLPEGWPHGYGKRTASVRPAGIRGTGSAAGPDPAPTPLPPSVEPPAEPLVVPPRPLQPPAPAPAPAEPFVLPALDLPPGTAADTHPHPPRRRFRLPTALHPLLWADRKAVLGLGVLLLLAVAYSVQHFWLGRPQPVAVPALAGKAARSAMPVGAAPALPEADAGPEESPAPESGRAAPAATEVVVDIAGRVVHPGIRALPTGSRVADALRAAGGPQPGVDTDGLNLARVLVDGEQVLVGQPAQPGGGSGQSTGRGPVSINRATLEQLDALPGIGPVLARHILDFREQHGPFRSLDQLRQVSGIGDRKYTELRLLLTL